MKIQGSVFSVVAIAALGASALVSSSAVLARDVAWSVGIASPGVQIGVSNAPQVIYRQPVYSPQTVYYSQPQVVYLQPQVTYVQPQVVYAPQAYYVPQPYYAPQPYYVGPAFAPTIVYGEWSQRHHGYYPRRDHDRHR